MCEYNRCEICGTEIPTDGDDLCVFCEEKLDLGPLEEFRESEVVA